MEYGSEGNRSESLVICKDGGWRRCTTTFAEPTESKSLATNAINGEHTKIVHLLIPTSDWQVGLRSTHSNPKPLQCVHKGGSRKRGMAKGTVHLGSAFS